MSVGLPDTLRSALARTLQPLPQARTLPGEAYASDALFALEQRAIFAREWIAVALECDVAAPGDFITCEVGGEPLLLWRGADGVLRAFYDICRHRGARLVTACSGRGALRLTCPYHGWSYGSDGALAASPGMPAAFERADHGLVPLRLECRDGIAFVCLEQRTESLAQRLAGLPDLSAWGIGALRRGAALEYDVAANWKLLCENYSECYHCAGAHPQLARLVAPIPRSERPIAAGAGFNGGPMRLRPDVETLSRDGRSRLGRLPGLDAGQARLACYFVVYPTLLLSPHPDYVLLHRLVPLAPDRTKVRCEILVHPASAARGPEALADVVEFWDATNRQDWALCERVQQAAASRGFAPGPYHPAEDCVHAFDAWYAHRLLDSLE